MDYIYEELSKFAPVYFEDMNRNEDGSITIDKTNIVYNIEGMYKTTRDRVRKDIPLKIDIWYLKEDLFSVEDMVKDIDEVLSETYVRVNGKVLKISRDSNFYLNIPDSDIKLRRKRLSYTIKHYS